MQRNLKTTLSPTAPAVGSSRFVSAESRMKEMGTVKSRIVGSQGAIDAAAYDAVHEHRLDSFMLQNEVCGRGNRVPVGWINGANPCHRKVQNQRQIEERTPEHVHCLCR